MARPSRMEIARVADGRDITRGFIDSLWWLQPQDSVLTRYGSSDYELYEELLRDDRVGSAYQQRFAALIDRDIKVEPGGESALDKQAAEHLEEVIAALDWDRITEEMLWGIHYGFSVAEAMWGHADGKVVIENIHVRNRRRFVWRAAKSPRGRRWDLMLRTHDSPQGEAMPDRKFWTFRTGADNSDEPYGRGLGHRLYWPVWFKRNQTQFWLIALEKFGMPTAFGRYLPNATDEDKAKLLAAVRSLATDTGVTAPDGSTIELIERRGSGTLDYDGFYQRMDRAITTVILSETMTLEDGSSLSQARVHSDVKKEVIGADAWVVGESFRRTVAAWLTDWNFPGAAVPRVTRVLDDPPDLEALAKRDKVIYDMGYRPTKEYVEETYDIEVEEKPQPPPMPGMPPRPGAGGANDQEDDDQRDMAGWWGRLRSLVSRRGGAGSVELAERDRDRLEQAVAAIDEGAWDDLASPIIEPVLRRAQSDPQGLLTDLASVWPEMDAAELAERLARVMFVASVWGRLETEEENRES